MKRSREVAFLLLLAQEQGFRLVKKKNGYMVLHPSSDQAVMLHFTNSDHRSYRNMVSDLRRLGVEIP